MLDPTEQCDAIDFNAAFCAESFNIAVLQSLAWIPTEPARGSHFSGTGSH